MEETSNKSKYKEAKETCGRAIWDDEKIMDLQGELNKVKEEKRKDIECDHGMTRDGN